MPEAREPSRIVTLDIVRGVAVMGILAMNIVAFAMPEGAYFNPLAYGDHDPADQLSWLLSFIVFDGKMRGLFSFLFGASMLLVIERADAAGEPSARIHFARMAWLLCFGLIHFYLIWWGDILSLYAPLGMAAWFFVYRSPGTLVRWGVMLILVQTVIFATGAAFMGPGAHDAAEPLNLYRSGFVEIAAYRLREDLFGPIGMILFLGWETLGYMLLGMAALKWGFLGGEWNARDYARIAAAGLGATIPAYALLAWRQIESGFSPYSIQIWNFTATTLLRPVMIVALAALVILLARRCGPFAQRIAAAGRAAFTNYLGTSILMTALFYGWGLGWFGTLNRASLWLVVLPMWALMLAWSQPWLERFRYGPFEWLWRSLARGRIEPMVKSAG